jgi:hypothetical protein
MAEFDPIPTVVDGCWEPLKIKNVYFVRKGDCVYDENGGVKRIKRKYGKFNRQIIDATSLYLKNTDKTKSS